MATISSLRNQQRVFHIIWDLTIKYIHWKQKHTHFVFLMTYETSVSDLIIFRFIFAKLNLILKVNCKLCPIRFLNPQRLSISPNTTWVIGVTLRTMKKCVTCLLWHRLRINLCELIAAKWSIWSKCVTNHLLAYDY